MALGINLVECTSMPSECGCVGVNSGTEAPAHHGASTPDKDQTGLGKIYRDPYGNSVKTEGWLALPQQH